MAYLPMKITKRTTNFRMSLGAVIFSDANVNRLI